MLQTVDSNNNNLYFIFNFYLDFYGKQLKEVCKKVTCISGGPHHYLFFCASMQILCSIS